MRCQIIQIIFTEQVAAVATNLVVRRLYSANIARSGCRVSTIAALKFSLMLRHPGARLAQVRQQNHRKCAIILWVDMTKVVR